MKPPTVTVDAIEQELKRLPPEKLPVVYDFVRYLVERETDSAALMTMLASEAVLSQDWDHPEEDAAWADL